MSLDLTTLTVEQKADLLRQWLRFHPDTSVELHMWTLYGTMGIEIREWPDGKLLHSNYGTTLGKRFDFALKTLGIAPESGAQVTAISDETLTIRRPIEIAR